MNNTIENSNSLRYAGTNAISPVLDELWEAYLFAGLPFANAFAAAVADYEDLFKEAA